MPRNNFRWITLLTACYLLWPIPLQAFENSPGNSDWSIQSIDPQDRATSMLRRMRLAVDQRDVTGTFVYFDGHDLNSVGFSRAIIEGVEYERLTHLDGPKAEIIRAGDEVLYLNNGVEYARVKQPLSLGPSSSYRLAEAPQENYQIFSAGTGRMANRAAEQVQIRPRDRFRLGYRLWLDQGSALPIRLEVRDDSNNPLEVFAFTEMNPSAKLSLQDFRIPKSRILRSKILNSKRQPIDATALPRSAALVELSAAARGEITSGSLANVVTNPTASKLINANSRYRVKLNWVPTGFTPVNGKNSKASMIANDTLAVEMMSDGLALFSVFVQPEDAAEPRDRWSAGDSYKRGATLIIRKEVPELKVVMTLVGEVPMLTAYKVLEAAKVEMLSNSSS